jgi:hypothetical protein
LAHRYCRISAKKLPICRFPAKLLSVVPATNLRRFVRKPIVFSEEGGVLLVVGAPVQCDLLTKPEL